MGGACAAGQLNPQLQNVPVDESHRGLVPRAAIKSRSPNGWVRPKLPLVAVESEDGFAPNLPLQYPSGLAQLGASRRSSAPVWTVETRRSQTCRPSLRSEEVRNRMRLIKSVW
jgi:hypothetical protein